MTDKPSLAERIEAEVGWAIPRNGVSAKRLRAIAGELREIAPKLRDIYTPSGMDEAELMELADRLARKEEP